MMPGSRYCVFNLFVIGEFPGTLFMLRVRPQVAEKKHSFSSEIMATAREREIGFFEKTKYRTGN